MQSTLPFIVRWRTLKIPFMTKRLPVLSIWVRRSIGITAFEYEWVIAVHHSDVLRSAVLSSWEGDFLFGVVDTRFVIASFAIIIFDTPSSFPSFTTFPLY